MQQGKAKEDERDERRAERRGVCAGACHVQTGAVARSAHAAKEDARVSDESERMRECRQRGMPACQQRRLESAVPCAARAWREMERGEKRKSHKEFCAAAAKTKRQQACMQQCMQRGAQKARNERRESAMQNAHEACACHEKQR